ncbi:Pectin acetylesterase [Seminavis robusta]|uniref:Pectin acetylesterase n=1 Tax=Seminavis robusta TaxID=568900 RepID=A0A9N8DCA5_9STRA|nr:Pectin acetylesterase [Seminavis robusta]|eukprot:Sro78_g042470.1 Pectin acetylesterase (536) ;mRNA; f:75435-77042
MAAILRFLCTVLPLFSLLALDSVIPTSSAFVVMQGYSLEEYEEAKCLDGSPGMYYYAPAASVASSNRWYIEMQGGGWCHSVVKCTERSKTSWGTTAHDNPTLRRAQPFFNDDPAINPLMHDWNKVFFRYCDGFSFSGTIAEPLIGDGGTELHLRGFDILQAGMADLFAKWNMDLATDVVIGGCSAGGLSSLLHCDRWADFLPHAKVACAPESGFFLDYNQTDRLTYGDLMRDGMELHHPVLPTSCTEQENDTSRCVYAEHVSRHIQTPIFVMQSLYDNWVRGAVSLSNGNVAAIETFGALVKDTVLHITKNQSVVSDQNGVFLLSCEFHCGGNDIEIDGLNKPEALKLWYEQQDMTNVYLQEETYQCEGCCLAPSPTGVPTVPPTSQTPTTSPTASPSQSPTSSTRPSQVPSTAPSLHPSGMPSGSFSVDPSSVPSRSPTGMPIGASNPPIGKPSQSSSPGVTPVSILPSQSPSATPSGQNLRAGDSDLAGHTDETPKRKSIVFPLLVSTLCYLVVLAVGALLFFANKKASSENL